MAIIFTLSLLSNIMAQDNADSPGRGIAFEDFIIDDSVNRYSLGMNVQFGLDNFLNTGTRANLDLILRKQVGRYNAIRYGLQYTSSFSNETVGSRSTDENSYTIGLSAGYEWQKLISHRWKGYYGVDLGGNFERTLTRIESGLDEFTRETLTKSRNHKLSLLPFIGVRFNITPYLFLSTELKLESQYAFSRDTRSLENYEHLNNAGYDDKSRRVSLDFLPYSGIYVHYIF